LPDISALLSGKAAWVVGALDRVRGQIPPTQAPLGAGAPLPYRGQVYRLIVGARNADKPSVIRDEAQHTLTVVCSHREKRLEPLLERWYRGEARRIIGLRVREFAASIGVTYTRLTIRDGRSRWGSCSSLGGLNFSWRLILAPPAVLDYVVIHELAHRRELNHSPRFWAIVAAYCPDYRTHQHWLKEHGAALQRLLREESA
jgi:predicted metal-dependent hydrolase